MKTTPLDWYILEAMVREHGVDGIMKVMAALLERTLDSSDAAAMQHNIARLRTCAKSIETGE